MIVIAGAGFVGTAVYESFKQKVKVGLVDPKLGPQTAADFDNVSGVIICVNTPQNYLNNSCDYTNVVDVLRTVNSSIPVIIKSAVDLKAIIAIKSQFPDHCITYSPEFLRAATAIEDFANQQYVIMGGGNIAFWKQVWQQVFSHIDVHVCSAEETSIIKYSENSFLALKVSFFNQLYDLCNTVGADFETVRHHLTLDPRIGSDHSYVPGPDGQRGWGGHCLPKDTAAFIETGRLYNSRLTLIEQARDYNRTVRDNE